MAKRTDIKKDLLDQLERNGVFGKQYTDLVDDYMALWDIKNKLIKDIQKRGVTVEWSNGPSQSGFKKMSLLASSIKRMRKCSVFFPT